MSTRIFKAYGFTYALRDNAIDAGAIKELNALAKLESKARDTRQAIAGVARAVADSDLVTGTAQRSIIRISSCDLQRQEARISQAREKLKTILA